LLVYWHSCTADCSDPARHFLYLSRPYFRVPTLKVYWFLGLFCFLVQLVRAILVLLQFPPSWTSIFSVVLFPPLLTHLSSFFFFWTENSKTLPFYTSAELLLLFFFFLQILSPQPFLQERPIVAGFSFIVRSLLLSRCHFVFFFLLFPSNPWRRLLLFQFKFTSP